MGSKSNTGYRVTNNQKVVDEYDETINVIKNAATGMGLIVVFIALFLTIVTIVLGVTVSPWFFIGSVLAGGYTLAMTGAVLIQRYLLNKFS